MITDCEAKRFAKAIEDMDVMPSARCLWTAGPALERDPSAGFNCTYVAVDHPRAFDEAMFLLCCGAGVGFSVERQYITKLPEVPEDMHPCDTVIMVADSKQGWASALRQLISLLYSGHVPTWNIDRVRPAGERLKTFGGRASGPGPLVDLFETVVRIFKGAAGRKLSSVECLDLTCIGQAIVVGGVRRSAMISLSNVSDDRMRMAKSGAWYDHHGNQALANNSAAYTEKPDFAVFMDEMSSLYKSYSGERGIFNEGIQKKIEEHGRRDHEQEFGCNPCAEIALPSQSACNLSEVIIRPDDTLAWLKKKVEMAAIFGTLQSTLTNWRYVRKSWIENLERERLLGISFSGICDHPVMGGLEGGMGKTRRWLEELRDHAEKVNEEWATSGHQPVALSLLREAERHGQPASGLLVWHTPTVQQVLHPTCPPVSQRPAHAVPDRAGRATDLCRATRQHHRVRLLREVTRARHVRREHDHHRSVESGEAAASHRRSHGLVHGLLHRRHMVRGLSVDLGQLGLGGRDVIPAARRWHLQAGAIRGDHREEYNLLAHGEPIR